MATTRPTGGQGAGTASAHGSTATATPRTAPSSPPATASPATTSTVPRNTTTTTPPPPPTTTTTTPPPAAALAIRSFAFLPSTLVIPVGTTVTVTNFDAIGHTWSSTTGAFDSGVLGDGQSYSHTFATPGTYAYRCDAHPSMVGTIVVQ